MLITRASEYAILSLIVLSRATEPVDSDTLSRELSISKSFLAKILQALAKNDILNSFKGVHGGFELAKNPKDISMLEVMSCVEGKAPSVFDCSPSMQNCPSKKADVCTIWPFLNKLQGKIDTFLATLTLADILDEE
ncbi:MAG: Rrf2 family transcriptional regulator [Sulfurimonadaceae bacterium]|jgi:Rrf2 family protein|nr:Rrf2 family transcriptional regulator [Sulfurimonadaceae bacterium]